MNTLRIAMWSGPRNISTAMMRAWGARPDTAVVDEPLYAHYLRETGKDHPAAAEVMAHHECDWRVVVDQLVGRPPHGKPVFYQKHMAHHLLPHIERDWLDRLTHAFLIRDPYEVLTSYIRTIPNPTLADTGLPQQVEIFERVHERTGRAPPVLDARDVLTNPRRLLTRLCDALDVAFTDSMLSWPPGRRSTDGVWAKHWYHNAERSTGFAPYRPKSDVLPDHLTELHAQCREYYERLYAHRLDA